MPFRIALLLFNFLFFFVASVHALECDGISGYSVDYERGKVKYFYSKERKKKKPTLVSGADLDTFVVMKGLGVKAGDPCFSPYALDQNTVYYKGKVMQGADPKTFIPIGKTRYFKDKGNVYCNGRELAVEDIKKVQTFDTGHLTDGQSMFSCHTRLKISYDKFMGMYEDDTDNLDDQFAGGDQDDDPFAVKDRNQEAKDSNCKKSFLKYMRKKGWKKVIKEQKKRLKRKKKELKSSGKYYAYLLEKEKVEFYDLPKCIGDKESVFHKGRKTVGYTVELGERVLGAGKTDKSYTLFFVKTGKKKYEFTNVYGKNLAKLYEPLKKTKFGNSSYPQLIRRNFVKLDGKMCVEAVPAEFLFSGKYLLCRPNDGLIVMRPLKFKSGVLSAEEAIGVAENAFANAKAGWKNLSTKVEKKINVVTKKSITSSYYYYIIMGAKGSQKKNFLIRVNFDGSVQMIEVPRRYISTREVDELFRFSER